MKKEQEEKAKIILKDINLTYSYSFGEDSEGTNNDEESCSRYYWFRT